MCKAQWYSLIFWFYFQFASLKNYDCWSHMVYWILHITVFLCCKPNTTCFIWGKVRDPYYQFTFVLCLGNYSLSSAKTSLSPFLVQLLFSLHILFSRLRCNLCTPSCSHSGNICIPLFLPQLSPLHHLPPDTAVTSKSPSIALTFASLLLLLQLSTLYSPSTTVTFASLLLLQLSPLHSLFSFHCYHICILYP